jgi:hypothetical protein
MRAVAAANAVVYWPTERVRELFERRCAAAALDGETGVLSVVGPDADAEEYWERAATAAPSTHRPTQSGASIDPD